MKKTKDKNNSFGQNIKAPKFIKDLKEWFSHNKVLSIGILVVMLSFVGGYYIKGLLFAATVNGKNISRLRVINQLEKYQGAGVVDAMITEELIRQEANDKGISISQQEIDSQVKGIEDSVASQGQTLDELLATQGMTRNDLLENIKMNYFIEKLLAEISVVTDEEVQEYIDENSESFPEDTDFEQVKSIVREQLVQEKMSEQYQSWIDSLKAKADINIFDRYK